MAAVNPEVIDDYHVVHRLEDLPLAVQFELKATPMADAGGSYQVGCVVRGEPLPLSRLIFAAVSPLHRHCLVHYESGGFAHTYSVKHFVFDANQAELLEETYVPQKYADLEELLAAIKSGIFQEG